MLIDTYVSAIGTKKTTSISNFIYRQIHRLKKLQFISVTGQNSHNKYVYKLSPGFREYPFSIKTSEAIEKIAPSKALRQRLKSYEIDLLTLMGEAEEYKLLIDSTPQIATNLNDKFIESRNKSTKLVGKIRVLKSVISGHSD